MSERIRSVTVSIEVDTNKQTCTETRELETDESEPLANFAERVRLTLLALCGKEIL